MKKSLYIFLFLFLLAASVFAQEKTVQGIVFDSGTKQRITRVYIYNTRTNKGFYNNSKGEFTTIAKKGDILAAALQGYALDTASVGNANTVIFYLKRTSIQLREVTIKDSVRSPRDRLADNQKTYRDAYIKGNTGDMLSLGQGGVGLSITSIYNLLSREGRNARHLQKIIEQDYRDAIIDYRYTKSTVSDATGLEGDQLVDFMQQYRPSYYFVLEANDYDLISFIKESYQRYLKNPAAYRLDPLEP